ncbi:hypothetical protein [Microcystis phage Mae-JY30]
MTTDPFLMGLPDPQVIEELSFEAIFEDMKADLIGRFPDIAPVLALESSAAVKVMQVAAYRELLLRARTNDAARANLLAYASGADLDHVGANASPPVGRMPGENDERFRSRILLTVRARNVGSAERYKLIALNTSTLVRDAIAYRDGRNPTVKVAILSTEADGVAPPSLLTAIAAEFAKNDNRMVNGIVEVRSAVTSVANIAATLTLTPGQPASLIANAETALRAAWQAEGGLGRDLTRDWIRARLMLPGVYSVAINVPAQDVVKPPFEAVSIGTVALTVAGENV